MSLNDAMCAKPAQSHSRRGLVLLAIFIATTLPAMTAQAQTTYVWNDSTTSWTTATAWTPNSPADWFNPARYNDALVSFGSQATIANQPNIDNNVDVRGISIDNTQAAWNISKTFGALNIGSAGLTVTGVTPETTTLSASVNLSFSQTWNIDQNMTVEATNTISGSGALTKDGYGELVLSNNANDFSGGLTINKGIVSFSSIGNGGSPSALGASPAPASNLKFADYTATLKYTGAGNSTDRLFTIENSATFLASGTGPINFTSTGSLAYSGSGPRTIYLDGKNDDLNTIAASIADGPGGPTSINKVGDGTWVLSGNASYTGDTLVTGGLLVLKGDRSAATGTVRTDYASVRIANGTVLGGNLILGHGEDTTFQANQGGTAGAQTNSPDMFGDSPGHVTILGNLEIKFGGILQFDLQGTTPGTQYDQVDVGEDLIINNASLDMQVSGFVPNTDDMFFILNHQGDNAISGQFTNAPEGSIISSGGYPFMITYFADNDTQSFTGGNDVALIAVDPLPIPEPATNILALSASLLIAARFSGRKRCR